MGFRAMRKVGLPYLENRLEDGQGDWRKENGRSALFEIERDGRVRFPATAAFGLRLFQELRGFVPSSIHGRQRCCHAWQGCLLRAEARCCCRRQEEMRRDVRPCLEECRLDRTAPWHSHFDGVMFFAVMFE